MKPVNVLLLISVPAALGGCALPTASYTRISAPATAAGTGTPADTFELSTTQLQVRKTGVTEADDPIYEVSVIRAGDSKAVFGITPNRKWYGVNTTLSITKVANTPLVDSISSEVEDKRVEFIKSAAKFIGTVIGVGNAAPAAGQLNKTGIYDLQPLLPAGRQRATINIASGLEIEIDGVPDDAVDTSTLALDKMSRVFFYSACRPAKIKVTSNNEDTFMKVAVADSRYVQLVAFPAKGKIQSHAQCGISVLPEKATVTPDVDLAQTALDEILGLREQLGKKPGNASSDSN